MLCYRLDLGNNRGIDETAKVETADVADEAEVEGIEAEGGEIKAVEDTNLAEGKEGLELLELQDGVEVKDVALEEALEAEDVKVVDGAELGKQVQVEAVDGCQVLDVDRVEAAEVVDAGKVDVAALLDLLGRSSSGQSGKSRDDDADGLHFD